MHDLVDVTLYTKKGCGLCDEVADLLAQLHVEWPHRVTAVDIAAPAAQAAGLFERYRYAIPVVEIGRNRLHAPITRQQLRAALADALAD
jgi:hypothetical protein